MKRVLVFGAGAIGSLLGHRLASAGHEVTLVGRPTYVQHVQKHGLWLEERGADPDARTAHPRAVQRIEELPASQHSWDLALLTVKTYDSTDAARALAAWLPRMVPLLVVQNGVGGEELAQQVLEQTLIVSCVLTLSVSVLAPGRIRLETRRGGLNLAPTRKDQNVAHWAQLFAEAGMRVAVFPDYRAMKWSKLLLNIQANAIPAILDMTPATVFADHSLFALERVAFLEALAVMRALQLRPCGFAGYPVELLVWAMQALPAAVLRPVLRFLVASGRGEKKPSLQLDLAAGRQRSEALYLNGAVTAHAQRLRLHVPVNEAVLRILMDIASGRELWDEWRGKPHKLIAAVQAVGR
ncbi:MAG: hypothetical protein AMJ93_09585 [Anaerolineae bacterium SM23_84]|nr:MAG: hypothetical protein AMJ93_09585 [Anaerolineae bacterium SM23_84]